MIDVGQLRELVSGDRELLKSLVGLLKADIPLLLAGIEKGLETESIEEVQYAAHKLKGQLRNFFEDQVSEELELIEAFGKNVDRAGAQEALLRVLAQLPAVVQELDVLVESDQF